MQGRRAEKLVPLVAGDENIIPISLESGTFIYGKLAKYRAHAHLAVVVVATVPGLACWCYSSPGKLGDSRS